MLGYRDTLHQEATNLRNLSTAFAAQTLAATRAIDQILHQVQQDFLHAPLNSPVRLDYLEQDYPAQKYVIGLYVFDKYGRILAQRRAERTPRGGNPTSAPVVGSTGASIGSLHVDVANIDERSGHATLRFYRPLLDKLGVRVGTIVAESDSSSFQQIFDSVSLGPGGSVTLLNLNGTMLVRGPSLANTIGHSFRFTPLFRRYLPQSGHGGFETVSPIDGIKRIYGYDVTGDYPLVIIAGLDKSAALASWRQQMQIAIALLCLISFIVIFLAWHIARNATRQADLIAKLKASEARNVKSAEYLKATLNTLATPVWVVNAKRRMVLLNDAFAAFTGKSVDMLMGLPEEEALDKNGVVERNEAYRKVLEGNGAVTLETDLRDGQDRPRSFIQLTSHLIDEDGQPQLVSVLTDITERKNAERRLAYLADFDLLTELPNQTQFRRVLHEEIATGTATGGHLAVLAVSLERLQDIIDLAGHAACDDAMRHVAHLLSQFNGQVNCIARVKSNEFAILIRFEGTAHAIRQFAIEINESLSAPVALGQREFYLGPVIGISLFPQDGHGADELLRRADAAKHRAQRDNLDPIHFVADDAQRALDEQLNIEAQLRRALGNREFRVVYQPKVNIRTGRIAGFEALLRWRNKQLGEIAPARFIPLAESTGLIVPIGAWVIRESCRQVRTWSEHLHTPVKVAVNLSLRQFHQPDLISMIQSCLDDIHLPPDCLELEVTESTAMSRAEEVDRLLHEIRSLGVALSIDDFGTGYSSLAYLKRFPVQALKIDRAFVRDLGTDDDSTSIIRSIIGLGHSMKLRIVAEGVETTVSVL
ncbi:bifunctional diguanylate cyclase/phosphodiesterase [Noviherbaspirillum galbum]|uniref:EAL domain-containing protein n=1 Tax=Noviherbaspirillum galbum TaxID=2709383 RepID=A0A6B3SZU5_9BURK|nr:EAL domain-containing protein [Noviherbaspirillum galbum]NEX64659.1 EAL domain-containing protein [Noviherbaspirillum galbum]